MYYATISINDLLWILSSGDISSWVSCSWIGFALRMLIPPAVRMMGHALENALSWSWVPSGSVSPALIILSTMFFSQFCENWVLVHLCGIYLVCTSGCVWEEKELSDLLWFSYSLLTWGEKGLIPNSYCGVPRETAYLSKVCLCVWETHFPISLSSVTNG